MYKYIRHFSSSATRRSAALRGFQQNTRNRKSAAGFIFGSALGAGISYASWKNRVAAEPEAHRDIAPSSLKSTLPLNDSPVPEYATVSEFNDALAKIREVVGHENVTSNADVCDEHTKSSWIFRQPLEGEHAQAVVYPTKVEEVSAIMKICHQYRVPVVPFSGGTSLEGHFTPVYQGISLDMNKMAKILEIHPEDMDIVVQPGVTYEQVNEAVEPYKLRFGPDPGPGAEIGGMIGTNASGTNAYAQGTMRANVLGLLIVLADGTIVRTRLRPRKSSAGYSLSDLIVGSEGTLGVVVEATLKSNPLPHVRQIGLLSFPSISDAASMVSSVLKSGYRLDAMELMDKEQMRLSNCSGMTSRKWDENDTLLSKFAGPTEDAINQEIGEIRKLAKTHNAVDLQFTADKDEGDELWSARKNSLFSILSAAPPGSKVIGTDTALPISQLSRFIADVHNHIEENHLMGSVLGHVGDGNFHCCIAYNPDTEMQKVHDFVNWTASKCIELEGTCTGEHGIGMGKRKLVQAELGENAIDMMRQIKFALDPSLILNPGKIFSIQRVGDRGDELPFHDCH